MENLDSIFSAFVVTESVYERKGDTKEAEELIKTRILVIKGTLEDAQRQMREVVIQFAFQPDGEGGVKERDAVMDWRCSTWSAEVSFRSGRVIKWEIHNATVNIVL